MRIRSFLIWAAMASCSLPTAAQPPAGGQLRYPMDWARHLITPSSIKLLAPAHQAIEEQHPHPILETRAIPLADLELAPERADFVMKAKTTWEPPPFPELGPPPPSDLNDEARARWIAHHDPGAKAPRPGAFGEISTHFSEAPSAALRPRAALARQKITPRDFTVPAPFSSVRYSIPEFGLLQLSLYGGSTSFSAEQAFVALRNSVGTQNSLEGLGKQAFLGRYTPQSAKPPSEDETQGHAPFQDIEIVGAARPDLVDVGLNQARKAPAFGEVSMSLASSHPLRLATPPLKYLTPKVYLSHPQEYLVLVSYWPDKAVTMELTCDTRIVNLQSLIALALSLQQKILR